MSDKRKRGAERKPPKPATPKIKEVVLEPAQAVRVVIPPDIVPVIAHDHDSGTLEIVPLKKEAAAVKQPFSILEWFFGKN
ncbi:MAG: hypothetical protein JWP25_8969 [Bradyrhizobium sp.]|nr:hypothetical protein [Bradyrhizobium sp.]